MVAPRSEVTPPAGEPTTRTTLPQHRTSAASPPPNILSSVGTNLISTGVLGASVRAVRNRIPDSPTFSMVPVAHSDSPTLRKLTGAEMVNR